MNCNAMLQNIWMEITEQTMYGLYSRSVCVITLLHIVDLKPHEMASECVNWQFSVL